MRRASSRMSCVSEITHWFPMTFQYTAISTTCNPGNSWKFRKPRRLVSRFSGNDTGVLEVQATADAIGPPSNNVSGLWSMLRIGRCRSPGRKLKTKHFTLRRLRWCATSGEMSAAGTRPNTRSRLRPHHMRWQCEVTVAEDENGIVAFPARRGDEARWENPATTHGLAPNRSYRWDRPARHPLTGPNRPIA